MNDDWILDAFLKATTTFADHIILLDQHSNDRTTEIIKKYKKVEIYENKSLQYNEKERQELLIKKARTYGKNNILIALDVDEIFSPNFYLENNLNWLKSLNPGTSLSLNWANIHWERKMFWEKKMPPIIYIDDGQDNLDSSTFHRTRVPVSQKNKTLHVKNYDVIHLQYLDIGRVKSKHRWYQLYELKNKANVDFVHIYRKYHHMHSTVKKDLKEIPDNWILFLKSFGVDLTMQYNEKNKKWCRSEEISIMENQIPQKYKSKLDLEFNFEFEESLPKSTSKADKIIFKYLKMSQKYYRHTNIQDLLFFIPIKIVDLIIGKVWK
jgi:hypothetical protein